jgi:hypothetical protein
MATAIHDYDTVYWAFYRSPLFHYTEKEIVYHDLMRNGQMDMQFSNEAKTDAPGKLKKAIVHEVFLVGK